MAEPDESIEFRWIELKDLPLFNQVLEVDRDLETVALFKNSIQEVDGIIIVSPEYNSSIPGVLKNALDWASRPTNSSLIHRKPVGVIGATPGG